MIYIQYIYIYDPIICAKMHEAIHKSLQKVNFVVSVTAIRKFDVVLKVG